MRRLGSYPCQTILHTFKFQDVLESNIVIKGITIVLESNIVIKGITIVKFVANKSSCNGFGDSKRHTSEYNKDHECDKSSNDKFL